MYCIYITHRIVRRYVITSLVMILSGGQFETNVETMYKATVTEHSIART